MTDLNNSSKPCRRLKLQFRHKLFQTSSLFFQPRSDIIHQRTEKLNHDQEHTRSPEKRLILSTRSPSILNPKNKVEKIVTFRWETLKRRSVRICLPQKKRTTAAQISILRTTRKYKNWVHPPVRDSGPESGEDKESGSNELLRR